MKELNTGGIKILTHMLRTLKVKKIKDLKFDGNHPNDVNVNYEHQGFIYELPAVGKEIWLWPRKLKKFGDIWEAFHTSIVVEFRIGEFQTLNSVYEALIEEIDPEGRPIWVPFDIDSLTIEN